MNKTITQDWKQLLSYCITFCMTWNIRCMCAQGNLTSFIKVLIDHRSSTPAKSKVNQDYFIYIISTQSSPCWIEQVYKWENIKVRSGNWLVAICNGHWFQDNLYWMDNSSSENHDSLPPQIRSMSNVHRCRGKTKGVSEIDQSFFMSWFLRHP